MKTTKQTYIGVVESVDDPTCTGRIKVRIKGMHDGISTDQLPWVTYSGSQFYSANGGGSISIPRVGSQVRVSFKENDMTAPEWTGIQKLDPDLAKEIASDYQGSHVILYDSESDISIMFQPNSGLRLYYKGSRIQLSPDNTVTIHYGEETSGTTIQLSDGRVDIQGGNQVNISSSNSVNIESSNVNINGKDAVKIKGNVPGELGVNGKALITYLSSLASSVDNKIPSTAGINLSLLNASKEAILNSNIQFI